MSLDNSIHSDYLWIIAKSDGGLEYCEIFSENGGEGSDDSVLFAESDIESSVSPTGETQSTVSGTAKHSSESIAPTSQSSLSSSSDKELTVSDTNTPISETCSAGIGDSEKTTASNPTPPSLTQATSLAKSSFFSQKAPPQTYRQQWEQRNPQIVATVYDSSGQPCKIRRVNKKSQLAYWDESCHAIVSVFCKDDTFKTANGIVLCNTKPLCLDMTI